MNPSLENDPIKPLLDRRKPSAEIVTDERYGYDRIYPADDILDGLGALYAQQILDGDKNFAERFRQMRAAEDAYEAEMASETDNIITAPIAKSIINQQVAWITNQILSKDPYVTWKPLDGGDYEVPTAETGAVTPVAGIEGAPQVPTYDTESLPGDEVARNLQDLLQNEWTTGDFEEILEATVHAIHTGENPTYWRVDYDPQVLHAKTKNFIRNGEGVQIYGVADTEIAPRNVVRLRHVSGYNVTHSLPCANEQEAWWIAEKKRPTAQDLWEGIQSGRYDFARKQRRGRSNDDLIRKVLMFGRNLHDDDPILARADAMDALVADRPREEHDVRTVSFFHPFLLKPAGKSEKGVEIDIVSCIGDLHVDSGTWLNITRNWSWSGKRLLIPFFRKRRPHRFTGMSAAGDVMPIQNLLSNILHLQLQNKVQNNVKVFLYRENSATDRWFKAHPGPIRPNQRIPYDEKDDVNPVPLGSPIETTAPEIAMLRSMADDLLVRDETSVPNRTPGSTVAQVYQRAKEQSIATMRGIRRSIARAAMMHIETVAQFSAYAIIPFNDKDKKRIVSKIIGFPREVISTHFSCQVTATGDDDSAQARFEKAGLLSQRVEQQNESDMKLVVTALDGTQTQAKRDMAKFMVLRGNRLLGEQIRSYRLDTQHFVIDERKFAEWEQSLKAEAAQKAQEAANAPPPQPPPPQIKVSLSGKLTPQEESEAAAMVGLQGAQNANVPSPSGPGAIPAPPSGQGAPPGVPGQPVLPGVPGAPPGAAPQPPTPPVR